MAEKPVGLLGLGFTASRLAWRLLADGRRVFAATRTPERFTALAQAGLIVSEFNENQFPRHSVICHSIPPIPEPDQTALRAFLLGLEPSRVVYVSATSVYGDLESVDAGSIAAPSSTAGLRRLEEERWIQQGPWSSLILRAAAIYGPGRGAHRRVLHPGTPGDTQRRGPSGVVSRIHADDLGSLIRAGLDSDLTGAFPVADDYPCSTHEILRWSAEYLGIDPAMLDLSGAVTTGRRVDGKTIREQLRVRLEFPDFRSGIPACLREEGEKV